ncbi:cytochrome c-type biogenesis protein CcmH [Ancylobacter sp. A5.8]|uniref:cytochrome c-type biogenesis protein n=1 Tax=Ancylobacter gelatini TaxID=2919920 RepID=UPI001F4DC6E0|nr:cytochrome c-type biogenesis protein [Ancylobacter gelatini]MCJ8143887.1 cytochrome c-type biogenesis protein CcmH [Ancylobacter gelatini]
MSGWRTLAAGLMLALALAAPAHAVQPDEVLADPAQEARARTLSKELRCMVCQNQSIDDSDAPLAKDLRLLVRERIEAGDSDRQVLDYLVARYGEFVLLRPSLHGANLLLWGGPFLILFGGALALYLRGRRREVVAGPAARLSVEEEAKLRQLMGEKPDDVTKL